MVFDSRNASTGFRLLNPELFMRPNMPIAVGGTCVFIGVCGWLYYDHQRVQQQRLEEQAAAEKRQLEQQARLARRQARRAQREAALASEQSTSN
jgi:hypothetical protein